MKKHILYSIVAIILLLLFIPTELIFAQFKMNMVQVGYQNYKYFGSNKHRLNLYPQPSCCAIWNDPANPDGNSKINLNENFTLFFKAQFSRDDHNDGADGIVFMLQNNNNQILDGMYEGGRLGYIAWITGDCVYPFDKTYTDNIDHSIAIEFDTFNNGEAFIRDRCPNPFSMYLRSYIIYNDPWPVDYDHISIVYDGKPDIANDPLVPILLDQSNNAEQVEKGFWYCIRLDYVINSQNSKVLSVTVDGQYRTSRNIADWVNNPANTDNGEVFWGFIGTSEWQQNDQTVQIVSLTRNGANGGDCGVDIKLKEVDGITLNKLFNDDCAAAEYQICNGETIKLEAYVENRNDVSTVIWKKKNIDESTYTTIGNDFEIEVNNITKAVDFTCELVFTNGCRISKTILITPDLLELVLKEPQNLASSCYGEAFEINRTFDENNQEYVLTSESCCAWITIGSLIKGTENYSYPGNQYYYIDWTWEAKAGATNIDPLETISNQPWKRKYKVPGMVDLIVTVTAVYHYLMENGTSNTCTRTIKIRLKHNYNITFEDVGLLCNNVYPQLKPHIWTGSGDLFVEKASEISIQWHGPHFDGMNNNSDDIDFLDANQKILKNPTIKSNGTYNITVNYKQCTITGSVNAAFSDYQVNIINIEKLCNNCSGKLKVEVKKKEGSNWVIVPPNEISSYTWKRNNSPITLNEDPPVGSQIFTINDDLHYEVLVTMTNECEATGISDIVRHTFDFAVQGGHFCNESVQNPQQVMWSVVAAPIKDCSNKVVTFEWENITPGKNPGDGFAGSRNNVTSVQITQHGKYKIIAKNIHDCILSYKEFEVFDYNFSVTAPYHKICNGNLGTLSVQPNNPLKYSYLWTMEDGSSASTYLSDNTVPNPILVLLPPPGLKFKITVTMKDEPYCSDFTLVEIILENIQFEAHPNYAVCIGESIQLRINLIINGQTITDYSSCHFEWSPTTGLDNPYSAEPNASPDVTTTYSVKLITENGCEYTINNIVVNVIKPDIDFTKRIYFPIYSLYWTSIFNGILKENNCGMLIYAMNVSDCDPNGTAAPQTLISLNPNGELGLNNWVKKYPTQTQTMNDLIYFTNINTIFSKDFHNKVKIKSGYIAIGNYKLNGQNYDVELLKINNDGSHNSTSSTRLVFGTSADEYPTKVIQTNDDGFVIAGKTMNSGAGDIFIVKRNNDLSSSWARTYGTSNVENVQDLIETDSHDLIIVGSTQYGLGRQQTLIIKVNGTSGNLIWANTYDISSSLYPNWGLSITSSKNGGYYIGGCTKSFGDGSRLNGQLFKISENGSMLWSSGKRIDVSSANCDVELNAIHTKQSDEIGCLIKFNNEVTIATISSNASSIVSKGFIPNSPNQQAFCGGDANHIAQPILLKDLLQTDFTGFTSAAAVYCKGINGSLDYNFQDLILNNTKNLTFSNECYQFPSLSLPDYNLSVYNSIYNQLAVNPFSFSTSTPTFNTQNASVNATLACSTVSQICYCDDDRINVTISQKETPTQPNQCCYQISFHATTQFENCNIQSAKIQRTSYVYQLNNMQQGSSYGPFEFCLDDFTGTKTIIIDYLDAGGNVVCSTTQAIQCKCDCEDFSRNWNKLTIKYDEPTNTADECCYPILIDNQNDCAFRDVTIKVKYSDNLDGSNLAFTGSNEWTGIKDDINHQFILTRGSKQINGKSTAQIGTFCVKRSEGPKTISFKIDNINCPKEWKFTLGCDLNCCQYITDMMPTLPPANLEDPDNCCYLLHFNILPSMVSCANLSDVKISSNGVILWKYSEANPQPQPTLGLVGPKDWIICIPNDKLAGLPEEMTITIEFISPNGVVCTKTATITNCYDCCEDIKVTLTPKTNCCYHFELSNYYCQTVYSMKIINYYGGFGNNDPHIIFEIPKLPDGFGGYIPLALNTVSGDFCIQNNTSWSICFYDENDNLLCCKHYPAGICQWEKTTEPFENERGNYSTNDDKNCIKDLKCIPNPVFDKANIYFELIDKANVTLELFSSQGIKVGTIYHGQLQAGLNSIDLDTKELITGLYYIRIIADYNFASTKFILLK